MTLGTYELYCTISGHAESGMAAEFVVADADTFGPAALGSEHAGLSPTEMDQLMVESMNAFPAETEGIGNQISEPEILADGAKKFYLTAEVIPAFDKPMVLNDAVTIGLSLNGRSFPATPSQSSSTKADGAVQYCNEGLTAHPMHLHQFA
ncbi:MAG: FtsP/CotA-like multicopper oxidase with cupredoxin domain [Ilumatobacter sp.]